MTFLELEQQYKIYREELIETIQKLGGMCSNFPEDNPEYFAGLDFISNPYELGYDEKYDQHWIDISSGTITINFSYEDGYDEICDSNSQIKYPLKWLEAIHEGSTSSIGAIHSEIVEDILKYNKVEVNRGKRNAIYEALRYNLITKEDADNLLKELD